ncbi:MAG: PaREP1 family protein [Ignisphaera sp.]|nr:PaREP1 family protein [Ignisphaera sp.]
MELEKVTEALSEKVGEWFMDAWNVTNFLHVWGFSSSTI